jgi:hypothetical protein
MEIGGLPAHPLIIHAAVVLTPLAGLLVILFAVHTPTRWATRWPAAIGAVVAALAVWAARISGQWLLNDNPALAQLVQTHQQRGQILSWVVIAFAALAVLGAFTLGGPSALASGRGERPSRGGLLQKTLPILLVLVSLGVIFATVLTGDAGARAVWGG